MSRAAPWSAGASCAANRPARRPETGKIALLRVRSEDGGKYYVSDRDLGLLQYLDQGIEVKAIDAESGDVLAPSKDIKTDEEPK